MTKTWKSPHASATVCAMRKGRHGCSGDLFLTELVAESQKAIEAIEPGTSVADGFPGRPKKLSRCSLNTTRNHANP